MQHWLRTRSALSLWIVGAILAPYSGSLHAAGLRSEWLIESGPIDSAHYFGDAVANGMIGVLSSPVPFRTQQTVMYAYEPLGIGTVSSIARGFNLLELAVTIDDAPIDAVTKVTHLEQRVDMRTAGLSTSFDYGDKARISYTMMALRQLPYTALLDITIVTKKPIKLQVTTLLDPPAPEDVSQVYGGGNREPWISKIRTFGNDIEVAGPPLKLTAAVGKGPLDELTVAESQAFAFDSSPDSPEVRRTAHGELSFSRSMVESETFHFALVASIISSAHVHDPLSEAQRLTGMAVLKGVKGLVAEHQRLWADLWKSDVKIDGDNSMQNVVHNMIYHLYSSIRQGTGYSIPPMGLSRASDGYLGHIFWDADTWMFPALLALRPELAREIVDYRFKRLAAAQRNAARYGFKGAMYPWQSAESGEEETSLCCLDQREIHITADVALAAWHYYRATQDRKWLRERGYPILAATADFWVSRVTRRGRGHYDLDHVVAANEDDDDVDNDAFTNAAAKENLEAALKAAALLGMKPDPEWEKVRENIPILKFPDGVTQEHARYRGEQIKQADVSLLAYPLAEIIRPAQVRRDLDYYEPRTMGEGAAMAQSITSIEWERMGVPQEALERFRACYLANLRPPFDTLAEGSNKDNPYFLTGAGGALQALIYGFGGLELTDRGFVQKPTQLPKEWRSLTLTGMGPTGAIYTVH